MGEGSVTQSRHQQVVFERDVYKEFCEQITKAVLDEGIFPPYHRSVLKKHKKEWPYLWVRIEKMIYYMKNNNDK